MYTTNTLFFFNNFTILVKLIRHMSWAGLILLASVISTKAKNELSFADHMFKQRGVSITGLLWTTVIVHTSLRRTWKQHCLR